MTDTRHTLRDKLYERFSPAGIRRRRRRRIFRVLSWWLIIQPIASLKRLVDFLSAAALLLPLSPFFFLYWYSARQVGFVHSARLGRWGVQYEELSFPPPRGLISRLLYRSPLSGLPLLINILRGDLSFVGPRRSAPGEMNPREQKVRLRLNVRPGLVCLRWIRVRANIAYSDELDDDTEYVTSHSLAGDIGIALRAIPAMLYGPGVAVAPDIVSLLGIPISNMTMAEALDDIMRRLEDDSATQICFVNADCANIAGHTQEYYNLLNRVPRVFADGIGIKLAGKLLRSEIRQNVNGTDLFPRLCSLLAPRHGRIFLLGARPGIVDRVKSWVESSYPGVIVCGTQHGFFSSEQEETVISTIAAARADLLLVAFGAPKQDLWIASHLDRLNATVSIGVGGLFDFYSGTVARAPQWMREIGLEWLFRFLMEPRRMWRRYFVGNCVFLWHVIRQRLSGAPR